MLPDSRSVEDDLNDAAKQVEKMNEEDQDYLLNPDMLKQYAIVGRENEIETELSKGQGKISSSGIVSVKSNTRKEENGKAKVKNVVESKHGANLRHGFMLVLVPHQPSFKWYNDKIQAGVAHSALKFTAPRPRWFS